MRIEFVILHYQNSRDTFNCVNSLMSVPTPNNVNVHVIIIDNGSPNGSGREIAEKYANDKKIEVILLEDNLGFSRANNIGYEKARDSNPDAIVMSNNDILFEDKDFLHNLEKSLRKNKDAAIICPDIVNLKTQHQNPMREEPLSIGLVKRGILYRRIMAVSMYFPIVRALLYKADKKRLEKWEKKYYSGNISYSLSLNLVPHGAFVIYTKRWLKNEIIAFPCETFMYMEEDFLAQYVKRQKYQIVYDKDLKVRHLEGGSTNTVDNNNKYKLLRIKYGRQADAMKKYKNYMELKR